jgi:hypothetical protein
MSDDRKWIQDFPVAKLDHIKREIVAVRFYEIPAEAGQNAASQEMG